MMRWIFVCMTVVALAACGDDAANIPSCTLDNCAGCCDGDRCVAGTQPSACGTAGFGCEACDGNEQCAAGRCVAECGPSNCAGCCDGAGNCIEGDDDTACGVGGGSCDSCGADVCSGGRCIASVCAASCGGCCNGSNCVDGDSDLACGLDGISCVTCGPGRACSGAGTCALVPTALWNVIAVNAEIQVTDPNGDPWDAFGGLPDPFIRLTAGGVVQPAISGSSPVVANSITPTWDAPIVTGATAAAIKEGLTITLFDEDVAANDTICSFDINLADATFGGNLIELSCATATVRLRVVAP